MFSNFSLTKNSLFKITQWYLSTVLQFSWLHRLYILCLYTNSWGGVGGGGDHAVTACSAGLGHKKFTNLSLHGVGGWCWKIFLKYLCNASLLSCVYRFACRRCIFTQKCSYLMYFLNLLLCTYSKSASPVAAFSGECIELVLFHR